MKNLKKCIPVTVAAALTAIASYADTHHFSIGTANQFSIDFVNIGYAGNAGTTIDYQTTPDFSPGFDSPNDFGVSGHDAPPAAYGAVGYAYGIGKYEVTIDQFTKANTASGGQIASGNGDLWNSGVADWNGNPVLIGLNAPAAQLKWNDAARFANWLTSGDVNVGAYQFSGDTLTGINRSYRNGDDLAFVLPSEDEWFKAAYYMPVDDGSYSLYSSGLGTSPVVGTSNGWNYNPAHTLQHMWEVGSGAEEQNGTYDMMGNVWEWTETAAYDANYVVRGASAYAPEQYLDSQNYRLISAEEEANIGLRIAVIPEPNTMAIMVLTAAGIVGNRRFFII